MIKNMNLGAHSDQKMTKFAQLMEKTRLVSEIFSKKSMLCVGLDTSFDKLPLSLKSLSISDAILSFNKSIIKATENKCVAYKINTAFYEQYGAMGWELMQETLSYIPKNIFTIADAKRGDIGNTSALYAKAFFEQMNFDAVTVAPYMGEDSVSPFLAFKDKWVICLGLTSNIGSNDIQKQQLKNGKTVYLHTMEKLASWGNSSNLMFVTGATHPNELSALRASFPDYFFLVPGVGAQGGDANVVVSAAGNKQFGGLLINSSRGIIYASQEDDYATKAAEAAADINAQTLAFF